MSDLISRQEAIDAVEFGITYAKAIDVNTGESKELFKEGNDALKKAVERLKELPSAEPEINKQKLIRTMNAGIVATNTKDVYSCGMRNGIRWCRALLKDDPPKFEDASQYAESKPKTGKWIPYSKVYECRYECSSCGYHLIGIHESEANFCPNCGADMRGDSDV